MIVISYASYDASELDGYAPRVVHLDRRNRIIDVDAEVASLLTPEVA